ncbi:MAG: serine protease [Gammaproteobacteria bacterium]
MSQYSIRSVVMAGLIGAGVLGSTSTLAELQVTPRIIGGTAVTDVAAEYDAIPWQVALFYQADEPDTFGFFCGGSIIADRWILTAAHCAKFAGNNYVVAGTNNWRDWSNAQVKAVTRWHIHPGYDTTVGAQFDNDIALLELAEPIDLVTCDTRCEVVGIVSSDNEGAVIPDGTEVLISGWGTTDPNDDTSNPDILQFASINMVDCATAPVDTDGDITSNMICAAAADYSRDTCLGDSGGPLVAESNDGSGDMLLAGVTSFGYGCATAGYPGVYTRVANYTSWIAAVQDGTCCDEDPAPSRSSKSGGGALQWWLLLGLAGLGLRRKIWQR